MTALAMQDSIGAIVIIVMLWLVIKLAFGGPSQSSNRSAGSQGVRGLGASASGSGPGSKDSAAAQAWRESRDERQQQLKRRKQEMIEAARRKLLDQDNSQGHSPSGEVRAGQPSAPVSS